MTSGKITLSAQGLSSSQTEVKGHVIHAPEPPHPPACLTSPRAQCHSRDDHRHSKRFRTKTREEISWSSLLLCLFLLLLMCQTSSAQRNQRRRTSRLPKEITLGVILPPASKYPHLAYLPWVLEKTLPSIQLAVEKIRRNLLTGVKVSVISRDSDCNDVDAPLSAVDMYYDGLAHVLLGPVCPYSLAPTARYSNVWGMPTVSAGGFFPLFATNKRNLRTLTTVNCNYNKLADVMEAVFNHLGFNNFGIFMHLTPLERFNRLKFSSGIDSHSCTQQLASLFQRYNMKSKTSNVTRETKYKNFDEQADSPETIKEHLKERGNNSRSK